MAAKGPSQLDNADPPLDFDYPRGALAKSKQEGACIDMINVNVVLQRRGQGGMKDDKITCREIRLYHVAIINSRPITTTCIFLTAGGGVLGYIGCRVVMRHY
ncbi:hypothetical protein BDP55DRAFT_628278 [Colletotrichum godetiae]|uniref:Uncharacterized protein n=1 Tax=Colletotrichum godetiae TaxID=1209918 RepID=A0AAJ0ATW2_9PEZI|nr:uncharacterized protein BDP55DRAFT_628278 [Colletotrichum godetiae]KAK1689723.1 hypothetical protein BDP55DRAFT_628278 [Colletotrichum godetiae]